MRFVNVIEIMSSFIYHSVDAQHLRLHNTFSTELKRLATLILQMAPPALIMEEIVNIPDWPSADGQKRLCSVLSCTNSFPLSVKYMKYLNKLISRQVEDSEYYWQEDLAELILGFCPESVGLLCSNQECFAGFLLPNSTGMDSDVICCGVERAHNLVGMRTWGAGMLWCEIFYNSRGIFKDMCVLELGSGVGMTGLIAARSPFPPASVIMTDFTDHVLNNLQNNIDLDTKIGGERATFVHSCKLDWNDVCKGNINWGQTVPGSEDKLRRCVDATTNFDLLLAADCTYSEDIATALLKTIEVFLMQNTKKTASALVASCIRSMDTWMHFVHAVRDSTVVDHYHVSDWGHQHSGASADSNYAQSEERAYFYCEDRERIRMYCLVLKGQPLPSFLTANATDGSATYQETEV